MRINDDLLAKPRYACSVFADWIGYRFRRQTSGIRLRCSPRRRFWRKVDDRRAIRAAMSDPAVFLPLSVPWNPRRERAAGRVLDDLIARGLDRPTRGETHDHSQIASLRAQPAICRQDVRLRSATQEFVRKPNGCSQLRDKRKIFKKLFKITIDKSLNDMRY